MSDVAVHVEHLSKRYKLGQREPYKSLRDVIAKAASAPFHKRGGKAETAGEQGYIWALDDVNFDIKHGEAVGIIGRNGAGKSTLLKILSRITKPTKGKAEIYGRVGSLLEVGTGFHPELTGRENIYLNGAILGMNRSEIQRRFDEIVDFAEIEQFLDTPVKRYSSGMYVRLAFAVAAHLEPEILLVDEVLAVGDAEFQKKCLGKMGEVEKEGRTVLFVSHNMTAVKSLCRRVILLEKGKKVDEGLSEQIIDRYISGSSTTEYRESTGLFDLSGRINSLIPGHLIARQLMIENHDGKLTEKILMGKPMRFIIELNGFSNYRESQIGIIIKNLSGQRLTSINTQMSCSFIQKPRSAKEFAILTVPHMMLMPGTYLIDIDIVQQGIGHLDFIENAATFYVIEDDIYGSGYQVTSYFGLFYTIGDWKILQTIQS